MPISRFKVNETKQKSFDAEHRSVASRSVAPGDAPKLGVKSKKIEQLKSFVLTKKYGKIKKHDYV